MSNSGTDAGARIAAMTMPSFSSTNRALDCANKGVTAQLAEGLVERFCVTPAA